VANIDLGCLICSWTYGIVALLVIANDLFIITAVVRAGKIYQEYDRSAE
jgi:hypothetical protein